MPRLKFRSARASASKTGAPSRSSGNGSAGSTITCVIPVIQALRAFDIVWVVNKGRNGLELISALVTQNVVGEASRVGFGSAIATIMLVVSLVFIVFYLATVLREEER